MLQAMLQECTETQSGRTDLEMCGLPLLSAAVGRYLEGSPQSAPEIGRALKIRMSAIMDEYGVDTPLEFPILQQASEIPSEIFKVKDRDQPTYRVTPAVLISVPTNAGSAEPTEFRLAEWVAFGDGNTSRLCGYKLEIQSLDLGSLRSRNPQHVFTKILAVSILVPGRATGINGEEVTIHTISFFDEILNIVEAGLKNAGSQ